MNMLLKALVQARLAALYIGVFLVIALLYLVVTERIGVNEPLASKVFNILLCLVPMALIHAVILVLVHYRKDAIEVTEFETLKHQTGTAGWSAWTQASILVLGIFVSSYLFYVYEIDRSSLKDAAERQERQTPDPNDPSTWALPDPNATFTIEKTEDRSSEVYAFSYENLAQGKIPLSNFVLKESGENKAFGSVYFKDGVASRCEPRPNNNYYTCENFEPGILKLVDVLELTEQNATSTSDEDGRYKWGHPVGIGVFTYTGSSETETIVAGFLQYGSGNSYTPEVMTRVPGEIGISVEHIARYDTEHAMYDIIEINTSEGKERLSLTVEYVRNGPVIEVLPVSKEGLVREVTQITEQVSGETRNEVVGEVLFEYDPRDIYPYRYYSYGRGDRYYEWQNTDLPRMYHTPACGMPYTFADYSAFIRDADSNDWSARPLVDLDVSIPRSARTLHLTTARYGYDPAKWGTITDTIVLEPYIESIKNGVAFNGYPTEQLFVEGIPIRHTLPRNAARPCDEKIYEQYQWVKEGNIYSLNVNYEAENTPSDSQRAFIVSALEAAVRDVSYVPAE